MQNQIVQAVQQRLHDLGWDPGPVDGVPGPATDRAIVEFKRASGLRPRPQVGTLTLHMLFGDDAARPKRTIAAGEPPWMIEARAVIGLHEARDYAELSAWLRSDGATLGDPRRLPWCGDFVQTAIKRALPDEPLPENPYLARNWLEFGAETTPRLGSVLVFWRESPNGVSGHVGLYAGEDATRYSVLGGNQRNEICIVPVAKTRLLGARWPVTYHMDTSAHLVQMAGQSSVNEA